VAERHAGYYLELAEEAAAKMRGPESTDWFGRLESEHDNLRAALRWALQQHRVEMGLSALPGLAGFWLQRGHTSEGLRWAEQILADSDQASTALRAAGLQALAILRHHQDESYAALQACERALALYRQLGDRRGIANCLADMGAILRWLNERGQAQTRLEESLLISRELDDKALIGSALLELVAIALFRRDFARVDSLSEELLSIAKVNESLYLLSLAIYLQGISLTERGEHERGRNHLEKGLPIVRQMENPWLEAYFLTQIGLAALRAGDINGATLHFLQALPKAVELDLWIRTVAQCLDGLALVSMAKGQDERALGLLAGADYFRDGPEVLSLFQQEEREQAIHAVRARMAPEVYHQVWADGRRLAAENRDEFIALALALPEDPPTLSRHPFDLTPRQIEVLALVAQGLTDAEVAETLVISPRTVNNHLTVIYQKLAVNSRTAAALVAQEHGIV
jgi:DNA-binding CsgD family transcriptional regulator